MCIIYSICKSITCNANFSETAAWGVYVHVKFTNQISVLTIIFPFNLRIIRFQVGRRCSHKFITGKKLTPCIIIFLWIFSVATISYFLMFSRLSLFFIHSRFRVKFVSLYNASFFALISYRYF